MARRESDKVTEKAPEKAMDGLLRHTLQNAAPPSDSCPDPEILAAYFERSLNDRETAEFELHLSGCALCREQQAAMARAHAPARVRENEKPPWAWLWDWRWLAPAMAVLALAAIWYARRPEAPAAKSSELPTLAMSRSVEPPISALPENTSAPPPVPPPSSPSHRANDALKKTEQREDYSRAAAAQPPTESEARELAARKAANELASNLGTDAAQQNADTLSRDAGTSGASAPAAPSPARVPAPVAASAPQIQVAVSSATNASQAAQVKTKQLATSALTNRAANLVLERRSTETLIRTPNPQVLWRIGSLITAGEFVERSIDGGATWMGQLPGAGAQLTAGSAPEEKVCWLVGRDGVILLTTNAVEWKTIAPPAKTDFAGVVAKDALEATVSAADGRKFTTTDGGESWKPIR